MTNKYKGPYRVINVFPALLYEIFRNTDKNSQIVHENRLKLCREINPWDILEEEIRDFERIHAKVRKKTEENEMGRNEDERESSGESSDEEQEDLERTQEIEQEIMEENIEERIQEEDGVIDEEDELIEMQLPLSELPDLPSQVLEKLRETISGRQRRSSEYGSITRSPDTQLIADNNFPLPADPLINVRRGQRVRKKLRHNQYDYSYTLNVSMKM